MSIRELTFFLESMNKENDDVDIDVVDEEIDDAKLTNELKQNLELLKKKHGGNLDVDKFVNSLKKLGAPVGMQTEEVMEEGIKELWQKVKKSKIVPAALITAIVVALEESGVEIPKDPIELIHFGELVETMIHSIAHYGPNAISMIASVMG